MAVSLIVGRQLAENFLAMMKVGLRKVEYVFEVVQKVSAEEQLAFEVSFEVKLNLDQVEAAERHSG